MRAHNDISVPILVSTLSVPAADTPNTVLLILLLTEILAHIHTQIWMNYVSRKYGRVMCKLALGVNLSRPHFLPPGCPSLLLGISDVALNYHVLSFEILIGCRSSVTHSTYMVVLQGALQGKCCKIVANKVGWKFVNIVAQNRKKRG